MHRATPLTTSFRSYSAGGARSVIDAVDDTKLMQEAGGNFMKGETRDKVESPQNYGFSSVVMDADKGEDGQSGDGAEAFVGFMGGNRSFPVAMVMDDRRHRLKELKKGDVAMFRTKDDRQQIHMTEEGTFWSMREDRKNRIAMVPPPQQDQQQQGQSGQSGQGQQKSKATGQKSALEDNKKSKVFMEQTKDKTHLQHNDGNTEISTNDVVNYYKDKTKHATTWNNDGISHKTEGNIAREAMGTDTTQASSIGHVGPTGVTGTLGVSQGVTASGYTTSSDARIKSNDRPLGSVFDKAMTLKVRAFDLHEYSMDNGQLCLKDSKRSIGLIAQDVRPIFPDLVEEAPKTGILGVQESKIGIIAVAALQEYVEQTTATIAALSRRIDQLERGSS